MGENQRTSQSTLRCSCGNEAKPGEDFCFSCLGEVVPTKWDYLKERPMDLSRVGTEEWKQEMREFWPWPFRGE